MALKDCYENPISTGSQSARDHYDHGLHLFLSSNFGSEQAFANAVEADPDFALGHAGLARALMMAGKMEEAKQAMARAGQLAHGAGRRERQHIEALGHLLAGDTGKARAAVLAHVRDFPRDAMAAQLCTSVFGLIGFSGKVGREAALLAYTSALLPHYGDDWWMMSMQAVSLCETGRLDESSRLMEQSLAQNPRNANGSHFKAHALYESGETASGRAYLDTWMDGYDRRSLLHSHLMWHGALWALHDGDEAAMWRAVDDGVAPGASKGLPINVLTDTAAILHRAELAGIRVDPSRWAGISDYAARFFPETGQSFADMHAALAHAMAGQGERLARIADTANGFAGDLVRPVARAWGAIAREDWALALQELVPALASTERFGGSRAQRDLLELTHANVLMKLGHADEARRALATRRPVLAPSPPVSGLH